jgi:hypothetical protein
MFSQHSQASTLSLPLPPLFPWLPSNGDRRLTIHRPTPAHHGRALGILGHATEHLTVRVAFCADGRLAAADLEALAVLSRLRRTVFDEYAYLRRHHHPLIEWLIRQATRVYGTATRRLTSDPC